MRFRAPANRRSNGRGLALSGAAAVILLLAGSGCQQSQDANSPEVLGDGAFLVVDEERLESDMKLAESDVIDFGSFYVSNNRVTTNSFSFGVTIRSYDPGTEDLMDPDTPYLIRGNPATLDDESPFVYWVEAAPGGTHEHEGGAHEPGEAFVWLSGTGLPGDKSADELLSLARSIPLVWTDDPKGGVIPYAD